MMSYTSNRMPDIGPLLHLIGLHGPDLIGIEVGTFRGQSMCAMLQVCNNIKELHGVDNWLPFNDYIGNKTYVNDNPMFAMSEAEAKINEAVAKISIDYCENSHKAKIHHMDSYECANTFPDEHFDFVFLDTYLTADQVHKDLETWYPKVKKGGLFTGHDAHVPEVSSGLTIFRNKNNIKSTMTVYADCFAWIKE